MQVVCTLNMFAMDQEIFVMQDSGDLKLIAKVPLSELHKTLPHLCAERGIEDVHIFGLDQVAQEIVRRTEKESVKKYSKSLRIEVN